MKQFFLIDKTTQKSVYGSQVFTGLQAEGLVGGPLQYSAYWLDISDYDGADIEEHKGMTFTPTTPPGATDKNAVILVDAGTWS